MSQCDSVETEPECVEQIVTGDIFVNVSEFSEYCGHFDQNYSGKVTFTVADGTARTVEHKGVRVIDGKISITKFFLDLYDRKGRGLAYHPALIRFLRDGWLYCYQHVKNGMSVEQLVSIHDSGVQLRWFRCGHMSNGDFDPTCKKCLFM